MEIVPADIPAVLRHIQILHTVRHKGRVIVVDHVPAEVCPICGDTLFKLDTVRHLEKLLETEREPDRMVPVYEFP